jgi:SAM-dependent methyltransferase
VDDRLKAFAANGNTPWTRGYHEARSRYISQTLANPSLMEIFRANRRLADGYGIGIDERCVEYPWFFANLPDGPERLLDAGSTLNHEFLLEQPFFSKKTLHILTLAPEETCLWHKGFSYLYADLRENPIRDGYYDTVACLSTLEHVGCDNYSYSHQDQHREGRPEDFAPVMKELYRVLKPGGSLLLTVPFGKYRNHGSLQQFDDKLLTQAIQAFGATRSVTRTFFRYTAQGWNVASAADCAHCEYVEWVIKLSKGEAVPLPRPVDSDRAAAARAVACVRLVKS